MTPSATFELTLQSTTAQDLYRVVAEWSPADRLPVRREREFSLEGSDQNASLLEAELDAHAYGEVLGQLLFQGGLRDLFAQARAASPLLRVLLAVEAKQLQALRWERLCAPFDDERWQFLGLQQRTPFSLYLPSTADRLFPPLGRRELRALVVVASPEAGNRLGVLPFDAAQALGTALTGLGDIPSVVLGSGTEAAGPPTLKQLCARLTEERFTLLHLICHGGFGRDGETAVFLHGNEGQVVAVRASALIERLRELGSAHGLPHLAFLCVCDSAKPEAEKALGGLAQRLVRELGMPAVVAMTERISQPTALALGQAFYARLRDHGEADRALSEACAAVRERGDVTVPALFSRLAGRPLFSDALDRPLTAAEIATAAQELDDLFAVRAPVLRPRARQLATAVHGDPTTLSGTASRERAASLAELEQLCEEALELSFSALAHGVAPPPYQVSCPFPGLRAFTTEQRQYFRGRDALIDKLLARFRRQSFIAVLGNSGCGKSSLVMAGLLPKLHEEVPGLRTATMQPGERPLGKLQATLGALGEAAHAVLYVDQFEEVFTLCGDKRERQEFLDQLLAAATPRCKVLISMRADFLGDCAEHKALREQVEGLQLVPPMTADELRNAVEEQAQEAGLRYETGLCELLLQDLKEEPGAMPLLQHALRELYERRHGRWLRVNAYGDLGRVQKAITWTAESVWSKLDQADRARLRMVMLELTEVREVEGGGSARHMRRRVPLTYLYSLAPDQEQAVRRLVNMLADERLLVKSDDEQKGYLVEVAHEALLRGWDRLQEWLTESLSALRLRQDLENSARDWQKHGNAPAYLEHLRERAELVRSFLRAGTLKLDPNVNEYFKACEVEEQRQLQEKDKEQKDKLALAEKLAREEARRARVLRRAAMVLVVLLGGAIGAAGLAYRNAAKSYASLLVALAQTVKDDPTTVATLLREPGHQDSTLWSQSALDVLHTVSTDIILRGHASSVLSVAFSPDGTKIVTGSHDKTARIWNADGSGSPVELNGHASSVLSAGFSPNGKKVVTGSNDRTTRIWNADGSGSPVEFNGHASFVLSVAFSPDGKKVVTGSLDNTARIWNADGSGSPVELNGHTDSVLSVAFSPDGKKVVTGSLDNTARIWNADGSGSPVELKGHTNSVLSVAFSPDGKKVVTGSLDNTARIWNADGSGSPVELKGHADSVLSVTFSPDGSKVVTGSGDKTARIWNADGSGSPVELKGHADSVNSVAFSPGGKKIVTGSWDKTARIWNVDGSGSPTEIKGHADSVLSVAFSPDGKKIVTGSGDKTARIWNADGSDSPVELKGHASSIFSVAFSPDGKKIVTGSEDKTARIWNADGSGSPVELKGHAAPVLSVAFSPDEKKIVTGSLDNTARIWNADGSGTPVELKGHAASVFSVAFSPDGKKIVTGSLDKTARIWNADGSGSPVELKGHASTIFSVAFSPDGKKIVTGSEDKTARIWNADGSGSPVVLQGHADFVTSVAFSPDGKKIVTGSQDKIARIWNADGFGSPVEVKGHASSISSVAFSPDGKKIVTGSGDKTARVWIVASDLLLEALWNATGDCLPERRRQQLLAESAADAERGHRRCLQEVARRRGWSASAAP